MNNIDFILTTHLLDLCKKIDGIVDNCNMNVISKDNFNFNYTYKINYGISEIKGGLKVLKDLYVQLNGSEPHVAACHAGLECGILGTHYPSMEMISFGPNIKGAHSPDERAQISSVQKFWVFLKAILAAIPEKP